MFAKEKVIKMLLATILEILVAGFIIYGLFNEDTLVDFEDRIVAFIKRKIRNKRRKNIKQCRYSKANADHCHCA